MTGAITFHEKIGEWLPSWHEIYAGAGLGRMDGIPKEAHEAATKIHFIDVGQGSATLLEQDGAFCLIDAGTANSAQDLIGYLQEAGVKTLDLLVMTHPHSDHIGGMVKVLENFDVSQVILPDFSKGPPPDTYTALRTLELLDVQGVPDVTARPGDAYKLGSGTLTVVDTGVPSEDYNDISVITLFEAPGVRCLTPGDAERAQWNAMLDANAVPRVDIYNAAHHGAGNANRADVLAALRPHAVVVSCGKDNSYGHPHDEALKSFASVGAQLYRTDESGSVIAYVNKDGALKWTKTQDNPETNAAHSEVQEGDAALPNAA